MKKVEAFIERVEKAPIWISVIYLMVSSLWIGLSDIVAAILIPSVANLVLVGLLKAWGFVFVTSLVLWVILRRYTAAQKRQINSLQRAALIFQHLTVGIIVKDDRGHVTDINPAAEAIFGYSKAEMVGQSTGLLYDLQLKASRDALDNGLKENGYWRGEIRFMRKDGQMRVCERVVVPLLDETQTMIGRISINQDITERKDVEAKLQLQKTLLSAVSEAGLDGVIVASNEGKCIYYNRNFLNMWTVSREIVEQDDCASLAGRLVGQMTDPEKSMADFERLMPDSVEINRCRLQLKDGRVFDRYSAPLVNEDSHYGRVWYYRDVTKPLALEARLRESQKMEAIGRLAGGIAHNFNNILTIVIGNLDFLLESTPAVPDSIKPDLDTIKAAAERAAKLTAQLLAFSRQQIVQTRPVAVNALIKNLEQLLTGLLGDNITVDITLRAEPDQVTFDANQLEQVLLNMAANARDAMPDGGRLTVTTDTIVSLSGWNLMLSVSDTGQGMDSQVQSKVFEPFFTTKAQGQGTGLGLSIAYGIVTQYGGHLTFESHPDQGTVFTIVLPLLTDQATRPTQDEDIKQIATTPDRATILVVDDNDDVRAIVVKILQKRGYIVVAARNGPEALTILDVNPVKLDLLISDVLMPEMYGPKLADQLRAKQPDLKVLFITGYATDVLEQWTLDPKTVINKPFSSNALINRVQALLA
ncbi:MAG: PAS domain S-box protein [Anaerolineae bacterium]|nr:PAS domain S-box protein [Anaerolineae bacterium]